MPRRPRAIFSLREIQRATGLHWPTLLKYSHDPRMRKHSEVKEGYAYRLWNYHAIEWALRLRTEGLNRAGKVKDYRRKRKTPQGEFKRPKRGRKKKRNG